MAGLPRFRFGNTPRCAGVLFRGVFRCTCFARAEEAAIDFCRKYSMMKKKSVEIDAEQNS